MKTKRIQIPEIEIPEFDGTKSTVIGKHILFVTIGADGDMPNPCEDQDGLGMICSLSRRHHNNIDVDDTVSMLESDPDVVPLSYFEHGNSLWMVASLPAPAGVEFQWDGTRFAGIWIPDQCVRESYTGQDGLTRKDWMIQQAASCCEVYTQWCNGEIYYYDVEAFELLKDPDSGDEYESKSDYRFKTAVFEDSCGGFYGYDYFIGEVKDRVRAALSEMGFSQRAIAKALPLPAKEILIGRNTDR